MSVKLKYHQATFDLLDEEPILSVAALQEIEKCERRCGAPLPASLREWYSLEGAEEKLTLYEGQWAPTSLKQLLKAWRKRPLRGICVYWRERSNSVLLQPDGSQDPPMYDYNWEKPQWRPFSEFVWETVLDRLTNTRTYSVWQSQQAGSFGPAQLDFLRERFREAPDERPRQGRDPRTLEDFIWWLYRFYSRTVSLQVTAEADAARMECSAWWDISADTAAELYEVLKRVWPLVGDPLQLSVDPHSHKPEAGEVLERLRKEFTPEFVVDLTGVSSWKGFVAAFNEGFCRHVGGKWGGDNWNAFDDYLSWPEEKQYRLVFRGWRRCRGLGTENRRNVRSCCSANRRQVEVVYD